MVATPGGPSMDTVWVFGDQLDRSRGALAGRRPGDCRVLLVESERLVNSRRPAAAATRHPARCRSERTRTGGRTLEFRPRQSRATASRRPSVAGDQAPATLRRRTSRSVRLQRGATVRRPRAPGNPPPCVQRTYSAARRADRTTDSRRFDATDPAFDTVLADLQPVAQRIG